MANLTRRSGAWYIVYNDAAGKQKWVRGYTDKTQSKELADRLENEKHKIKNGDYDPLAAQARVEKAKKIDTHLEGYKAHLQAKGCSNNHVSYTIGDIQKLIEMFNITNAHQITTQVLDQWVLKLNGKDSNSTINRRVGSVKAFLRNLHELGGLSRYMLKKYPKLKTLGHERRKRRALSQREVNKLLKQVKGTDRELIYNFALKTGLRANEISTLTHDAFNFEKRTLTVSANNAKNKNLHQTIPLHTVLMTPIKDRCKQISQKQPLFVLPSRPAEALVEDCKAAKISTENVDFHALRHTFITRLAQKNVHPKITQTLARHSTLETTLRYYTHFRQTDEINAINAV